MGHGLLLDSEGGGGVYQTIAVSSRHDDRQHHPNPPFASQSPNKKPCQISKRLCSHYSCLFPIPLTTPLLLVVPYLILHLSPSRARSIIWYYIAPSIFPLSPYLLPPYTPLPSPPPSPSMHTNPAKITKNQKHKKGAEKRGTISPIHIPSIFQPMFSLGVPSFPKSPKKKPRVVTKFVSPSLFSKDKN